MKPDLRFDAKTPSDLQPSWSAHNGQFINVAHEEIFNATQYLKGWQAPGDSLKLFEMGYYAGDVILEIGVYGGRSASAALLGALNNPNRRRAPQYFGIDIDPQAVGRAYTGLKAAGLDRYALIVCGTIESFTKNVDITPTMVFLDGDHSYDGVKSDLKILSEFLVAGTPVLCHDFGTPREIPSGPPPARKDVVCDNMWIGVQKACGEWEADGYADFYGVFGCSALYVTTEKCTGSLGGLRKSRFEDYRAALLDVYKKNPVFQLPKL